MKKKISRKKKKELCLLHASRDLSVLSPSKGRRKELAFLCYPLSLKENPHAKRTLQEKEIENKGDFQRSPGSPARLLTEKEGLYSLSGLSGIRPIWFSFYTIHRPPQIRFPWKEPTDKSWVTWSLSTKPATYLHLYTWPLTSILLRLEMFIVPQRAPTICSLCPISCSEMCDSKTSSLFSTS